ncbi:MAG: thioesterase [Cycloclasticus sp. symbiont of Poecilosclerida sp. M]|nr:MAG: thioesterase [Cycloclasticus sp. symbiont of Poecilosclerida sp. M]
MSNQDFKHKLSVPVRWGDADVYGHINNVEFVRYVESGRVAYCEEVLGLELVTGMDMGWVLADIQCSYLQQVHYPAHLEVHTRISKVGNKSATILAEIYQEGRDSPVLTSEAVMVWVNLKQQMSESVPDVQKEKISAFEKSVEGLKS